MKAIYNFSTLQSTSINARLARFVTMLTPESEGGEKPEDALPVDLRTLRAIRVLRPLKLVSGVPSKTIHILYSNNIFFLIKKS